MRNFAKWLFVVAIASLIAVPSLQAQGKSGKVKVDLVHNGHVISVAPEAVDAHLAHGDTYYNPGPTSFSVEIFVDGIGTLSATVAAGGDVTLTALLPSFADTFVSNFVGDYANASVSADLFDNIVIVLTNVQSNITGTILPLY